MPTTTREPAVHCQEAGESKRLPGTAGSNSTARAEGGIAPVGFFSRSGANIRKAAVPARNSRPECGEATKARRHWNDCSKPGPDLLQKAPITPKTVGQHRYVPGHHDHDPSPSALDPPGPGKLPRHGDGRFSLPRTAGPAESSQPAAAVPKQAEALGFLPGDLYPETRSHICAHSATPPTRSRRAEKHMERGVIEIAPRLHAGGPWNQSFITCSTQTQNTPRRADAHVLDAIWGSVPEPW